jgi:two-component system response regulator YesN
MTPPHIRAGATAMPQVILADDNIQALEGLQRHIPWHDTGCVCVGTAQNGVEALALCHRIQPDVVITDVKMPQMDGIELCRQLHAHYPDMQLIVMSAYDDFSFAQRAMAAGVSNYLLKPINTAKIAELTRMLTEYAQRTQRHAAHLTAFFSAREMLDLRQALAKADATHVASLLAAVLPAHTDDVRIAKEMAVNVVALLYQHLPQLGLPAVVDGAPLDASMAHVQTLRTVAAVHEYVQQLYLWVCTHVATHRNPSTEQMVARIQHHISTNFHDAHISTTTIAQKFHLSQSYLCQIYRSHTQTSIHTQITQLRMERACALLVAESSLTIADVSRQIGYLDAQYFTKVFRRIHGLTPSEYRELALQS